LKRKRYLAVVKRVSIAHLRGILRVAASSMEPHITTIIATKEAASQVTLQTSYRTRKQIAIYTSVVNPMPAVFVISIRKIVRPVDADEMANLAQHPKSLGTADVNLR